MDDDSGLTVGQRVRRLRTRQGMSLATLATLSGLSKGYLSRVENGERILDQRRSLHAVADALRVPVGRLTGQPYDPATRHEETVRVALADVSDALSGSELGEREDVPSHDLATLERLTGQLQQLSSDGAFATLAPMVPTLLTDLHGHAADPDGGVRQRALPILVLALAETHWVSKCTGEFDLAWLIAERAWQAAAEHGDPALVGFADFIRAQSLTRSGERARTRAGKIARRAAEALQQHAGNAGPTAEVYGSLHMAAAWAATLTGRDSESETHMFEAAETAERTGNGVAFRLWFGPNEMGILRAAVAVEHGDGGAVQDVARSVEPATMPSRGRQADFFIQMGRGLAQEPAQRTRAVEMLRRAERLSPMRTRMDPFVRQTVDRLLHEAGGSDLRLMAMRMGIIAR
jgi:transcriptional regulator with XRE-family HTH domain